MKEFINNIDASAMCLGKEGFDSWNLANNVIKRQKRAKNGTRRVIYKCHFCHKFHLGNVRKYTKRIR